MARQLQLLSDDLVARQPLADFEGFIHAREAYHRYIIELSGNSELRRLFPVVQVQIMRIQLRNYSYAADSIRLEDFAVMTAAMITGDADSAERAAQMHVKHTIERVYALPDRAFFGRT